MPAEKAYRFIKWVSYAGQAPPLGKIRISPYGITVPKWLREKFEDKGDDRVLIEYDLENKVILMVPSKGGYKINQTVASKLVELFKIRTPLLCPCEWSDKYGGWIVELAKGEEITWQRGPAWKKKD